MTRLDTQLTDVRSLERTALGIGAVALALCLIAGYFDRRQFFSSYLYAYVFWVGIPLGSLGVLMIQHLVGGTWGFVIQRPLEAAIRTFPLMAILFIPILFGASDLYPWARSAVLAHNPKLQAKAAYLNLPFFTGRAVVYFAIWIWVGYLLVKWSRDVDRTGDYSFIRRIETLSGPGLVLYGLTVTFSAIDWLMSLEPEWYSTMYGMIFIVSHGLVALAFMIIVAFFVSRLETLSELMEPWIFQDLGNMLLAFAMLWVYTSFGQFLLIWIENLNHEIPWYIRRMFSTWGSIGVAVFALQFGLPMVLLLSRLVKRRTAALACVAALVFFMHLVEMFWFVGPAFHPVQFSISWTDLLAPIGLGGFWIATFVWQLKSLPLLPYRDARFLASVEEHGLMHDGPIRS